jgi:hypothetical protein
MRWFFGGLIVVVVVVLGLITVDLTRTPPPVPPGRCVFVDNLILPNRCLSSCKSGVDCPTTQTKSYFFFWTEPTGCPDAIICGGG